MPVILIVTKCYTHSILALGILREPTIWVFITSDYPGIHDTGLWGYNDDRIAHAFANTCQNK